MTTEGSYNRLKNENSKYLLQHKENPVHWFSYGPEAVQKAKDEDKPIFLSIGYSSCHWCHVMEKESFENKEIAKIINDNFIPIKVDREEHPDLDAYYQMACQLFTQSGGWPLSAFLLPNTRPYFVGTYFPALAKEGQSSFPQVLTELSRAYREDRKNVEENADKAHEAIENGFGPQEKIEFEGHFPHPMGIMEAIKEYKDSKEGGFGESPKFPHYSFLEWSVEQMLEGMIDKEAGEHIIQTLERMLLGGFYDQARGGAHRYSTDEKWLVPHFEKMLYDQAGLLKVLSKVGLVYPSPVVFDALMDTLEYLETEMLSDEGYFFSAQDADSEGAEGIFFTFTKGEFEDTLKEYDNPEEELLRKNKDKLIDWFQITEKGNFNSQLNVISLDHTKKEEFFTADGWNIIRLMKGALFQERKNRIPPMTDNKGVASWNFKLISALVDVIQYCQIDPIKHKASELFNKAVKGAFETFIKNPDAEEVKKEASDNVLPFPDDEKLTRIRHSTTKEGSLPYLEDYVFFAETQLRIFEITGQHVFKDNFLDTLGFIQKEFIDEEKGQALTRAKLAQDFELYPNQPIPSFDSSFKSPAATLLSLSRRAATLFGDPELLTPIEKLLENITHECLRDPVGSGEALRALTYPTEAYKVVKTPRKWLENPEYVQFLAFFQPRFIFDHHEDEGDKWQICSMSACEVQGEGLKEFMDSLTPKEEGAPEGQQ